MNKNNWREQFEEWGFGNQARIVGTKRKELFTEIQSLLDKEREASKRELIEYALGIVQQYGYEGGKLKNYLWSGGMSNLEETLSILYENKVCKNPDKIYRSEIKKYYRVINQ